MKNIALWVTLIITLLIFWFGNAMTTTPGRSSGNGNPAIILFIPLFILFIVLVFQWFKIFRHKIISIKTILICSLVAICHQVLGIYYQMISFRNYRDFLAEVYEGQFGEVDWQYVHSITTGLSIHINNQYFNINTYLLFLNFSLFVWLLSGLIIAWLSKRNRKIQSER